MADRPLAPPSIPDGSIAYEPHFLRRAEADAYFDALRDETPWRQESVQIFGRRVKQPRLVAWYGDRGCVYTYSGLTLDPLPWTSVLETIKSQVEDVAGTPFNSALLNYYRDGADSMGWHADDERELGDAPTVASVSLGACRAFQMKHKRRRELEPVRLELEHGSLLLMRPPTQANWLHQVPKRRRVTQARINATFRFVTPRGGPVRGG